MSYSAVAGLAESIEEQTVKSLLGRRAPDRIRVSAADGEIPQAMGRAASMAVLAPSLVAEMAPLSLFWHSHLPLWQMSAMMAASWAFTWWMTWILIVALHIRTCGSRTGVR